MSLLKKRWVQITLAALLGITIGALFYPTKQIEERTRKEVAEQYELELKELKTSNKTLEQSYTAKLKFKTEALAKYKEETSSKLRTLTTENRELHKSMKRRRFKLIKPDGTIIEKEYEESQTDEVTSVVTEIREEFNRKVSSIESRWKSVHQKRVKSLKEEYEKKLSIVKKEQKVKTVYVEKEKIVKINPKSLRPEVGLTLDKAQYFHVTYSLWGPVFIGGGITGDVEARRFDDVRLGAGIEL